VDGENFNKRYGLRVIQTCTSSKELVYTNTIYFIGLQAYETTSILRNGIQFLNTAVSVNYSAYM
jgi:hypothetical protein